MTGICSLISNHECLRMAKSCFLGQKKINLDGQIAFKITGTQKKIPEENYSTSHSGGGSLLICGTSLQENLNYNFSVVDKKQQII